MDKSPYHYAPYGKIGGWLTVLFFAMSGFLGSIFIYGPILPLVFLWPWLFRRLTEVLASGWKTAVVVSTIGYHYRYYSNLLGYCNKLFVISHSFVLPFCENCNSALILCKFNSTVI